MTNYHMSVLPCYHTLAWPISMFIYTHTIHCHVHLYRHINTYMCVYMKIWERYKFLRKSLPLLYCMYSVKKKKYFPIFYFAIVMATHQTDFMSTDVSQTSVWKTLTWLCDNSFFTAKIDFWRKWLNSFQLSG